MINIALTCGVALSHLQPPTGDCKCDSPARVAPDCSWPLDSAEHETACEVPV
jgi:hypothetical protein